MTKQGKSGSWKPRAISASKRSPARKGSHSGCSKKRSLLKDRIRGLESRVLSHEARIFELERYLDVVTTIDGRLTKINTNSEEDE